MKNAAKRLVALLLAMSMALSLLSTSAWATNAVDELTDSLPAATEQDGNDEAPVVDEPAADEPEDVPAEAPEEGAEEPAANEETTPDDTVAVPEEEALNTEEEPVAQAETDAAPKFQIDLSRVKFNVPSYGDMLAAPALKDVDEVEIDEDDPIMASLREELDDIVVTSEPEDAANGEDVLNGADEGATEEKVPLTEEQKQNVMYMFQQYLKHWEDNADVLGVQSPFFLMFNDDEDELGGLGEMLVLAGVSVEDVRSGNYGYDDLVGMIQNFTLGNQYGVEYYGADIKAQRDDALQTVKDSGAKTDVQKMLVLNDWLAQQDTFDMSYIMNMGGTAEMKAENEVKNEHYDTMYNAIYAQYEESIRQQFHDQIYAGIEASLRQQYYEIAIEKGVYQNAYEQALAGYQEAVESGEMTQEQAEAAADEAANDAAEKFMDDNAEAIAADAPGFVEATFGAEAAAQISAGADEFIKEAETEGVEVQPGVKMTIEQLTQQQMDQPLDDLGGMTPNEAVPAYAAQAATGLTDGIIGYWQGSQFGALALGASVCLGYAKAYAYLIQCQFADLYTTDGNYNNASSWKKAADLYYDADGKLDINQNYNVDMVRITYDASVTMYGETQDSFNSDHFWNAVKVNGKWYYVDPCYADVYVEVMSQTRVEAAGNMNHMYFLFSDTSARKLYDGNFSDLKSLYGDVATDTTYEDAWVSRIKSNTSFDGSAAYYVYDSSDVISMMDQFGSMGGLNRSSESSTGFSESEYKIVKHDLSASDADDGDTDYEALIEFNYKADEDDDTTVTRVYNPTTGKMEENETLTKLYAQFQDEQTIYPSIALTMGLYNNKIYFNLSNAIFSYDLETGEVVQVKEYNDVYAQRDTTMAFGGMAFNVIDKSKYQEGDKHYQKVENAPIAGLTIKTDGKLYVDIATNYAYISGKSDIEDSTSYGYEFQESNYNPSYNSYFNDMLGQFGYEKEVNDNDEFMWSAVFHDSVAMSTVTGSHDKYETVTVAPFCGRDGYTEERSTNWGVIKAGSRVYDEGSACDHHYVHFNETYYTKDDDGNWNTGDCYVCTICGYAVEESDDGTDDDWDESKDTYEMAKAKAGHVYSPVSDDTVTWAEDYTSATITNADLVCEPCDGKALDCLLNETTTISGQTVELTDVESTVTGTCDKGLTTTYTATGTTAEGKNVSTATTVTGEAGVHNYEGEFTWSEDYKTATADLTCTVCGDKQTGVEAVVTSETTDPTCEEDGKTVYTATATVKDADDKELGTVTDTKEVVLEALGHDYGEPEWGEWTETEDGYAITATFTCANDASHVETVVCDGIPSETDATCTEPGTTTYTASAEFEGKTYELPEDKAKVVSGEALGHDYGEPVWTWSEDYKTATVTVTCARCDDEQKVDAVITSETTAATCEEAGKTVYTATATVKDNSGKDQTITDTKEEEIPALGHAYGEPEWGEWSETEDGYAITATFTCANDETHVEKVDGKVESKTEDATCTEAGTITYTATAEFEGETYELPADKVMTVEGEALGHDYGEPVWTWSEDYKTATVTVTCARCDDEQKVDAVITSETTAATCEEAGKTVYTATATVKDNSGKDQTITDTKEEEIPALGHAYGKPEWGEWTETEDGYAITATFTCANDETHVEKVDGKVESKTEDATCTEAGTITYTATAEFEGKTYELPEEKAKVVSGEALGHDYGEPVWTWSENYSTATVTMTCDRCGEEQKADADVTSETTAATCEEAGKTVYTATATVKDNSGKDQTITDTKEEEIPALGHAYGEPEWGEWTKKEGAEGYTITATFTCANDDNHVETVVCDGIPSETDATCTEPGTTTYTATAEFEGKTYELPADKAMTVEGEALGHDYEAEFTWNGVESATATFTCTRCGEQTTIEAVNAVKDDSQHVDPDCETAGKDVYVVTISFEGKDYTDSKEQAIAALGHDYDEQGVCTRCGAIQTLDTPVVLSATNSAKGVTVKWQKVTNATGYRVFRKTATGSWASLAAAKNVTGTSFVDTTAKSGTTYYYTIRAYRGDKETANANIYLTPYWSSYNKTGKSIAYIAAPTVTVSNVAKGVKVSWGKVNGAVKYRVFRKTVNGSWKKLKDVTTTSYKDTTAKAGTTYIYTVRCINKNGTAYTSSYDATGKKIARLAKTNISSLKNAKSKKMTVKWKKNTKATGYVIEYSTNKNFTKNVVQKKVTKKTTVSKTISGLKKGTKYYVRIRAYRTVSGTKYYSAWSAVKNLKITK